MDLEIPVKLYMTRYNMDCIPIGLLPPGYTSRIFQDGDEEGWTRCLNVLFPTWTVGGVRETIVKTPEFRDRYTHMLIHETDGIVGCAGCWYKNPEMANKHAVVSMVAILPEHQGKGMAFTLVSRLLHVFRECGYNKVSLDTWSDRLAAIKTYLKLGFEPIIQTRDDSLVWGRIYNSLAQHTTKV